MPLMTSALTKQEEELLRFLKGTFPAGIFRFADLMRLKDRIPVNGKSWRIVLDRLRKKGWVRLLEKGKYVFGEIVASQPEDSFVVAQYLVRPAVIAYRSALNHYGYTEQVSNTVYVQTTSRKTAKRILGVQYKFVRVGVRKLFGFRTEWSGQGQYSITEPEKTIVDCFDIPDYAGGFGEAVKGLCSAYRNLNKQTLWQYADRVGNRTVMKRIACIADILGLIGFEEFKRRTQANLTNAYSVFDPHSPRQGKHVSRWRLLANVSDETIRGMARSVF
jgi:predicted transcriptional regulator of viral defense system